MSSPPVTPIVCIDLTCADDVLEDELSPPVQPYFKSTDLKEAIRRSLMDQVNEQLRCEPRTKASEAAIAREAANAMLKIKKRAYRQSHGR